MSLFSSFFFKIMSFFKKNILKFYFFFRFRSLSFSESIFLQSSRDFDEEFKSYRKRSFENYIQPISKLFGTKFN